MLQIAIRLACLVAILVSVVECGFLRSNGLQKIRLTPFRVFKRSVDSVLPGHALMSTSLDTSPQLSQRLNTRSSTWHSPGFRPLSFSAEVTNDVLQLNFTIRHATAGMVTKPLSLVQPVDVRVRQLPAGSDLANASFSVDMSQCSDRFLSPSFWFEGVTDGKEENLLSVSVHVCDFELNPEYITWTRDTDRGPMPRFFANQVKPHTIVSLAQFSVDSKVRILQTGHNVTVPITLRQQQGSTFFVSVIFYDSSSDLFTGAEFVIGTGRDIDAYYVDDLARQYFSMSESQDLHEGRNGQGDPETAERQVDVTVATELGHLSGVIHVSGHHILQADSLVSGTYSDTPILVKRADQDYPLPLGKYLFRQAQNVRCSRRGSSPSFPNVPSNCSLTCWVNGRGISRVQIYKADSQAQPVDATVYQVYQAHAEAFLNLGPVQRSQAGDYICEVDGVDGSTARQRIRVTVNMH